MDCRKAAELLSAYWDRELAGDLRREVEDHLQACASCRQELALLRRLDEALETMAVPPPTRTAERVLARLPRRRAWWQSLALAASLVLGMILGGAMARNIYLLPQESGAGQETLALETFQDFPQGSWGNILASYQPEESNGT
jgi:anti-sigma factor RsiW